ncbi:alkaline ceramidase 3 [Cimex lectularius]|uniref:Alkaline ceramidase n=1 Tax=Cimex lectularius TaxID=79782 RepID=A0A8I6R8Q1_CIMLE|nr:alkaline ceramidase 3 [Cimex lectularius]
MMAPLSKEGFWGRPTSTIDWCEENYEFSYFIAEMTNTLSNLMMIVPPIWGMVEVLRQGFERKFIYCHILLLVVGLGSWAFHMTLLYEMQLFDELPMVWGTCVLVYCLSEVRKPPKKGQISNLSLFLFLASFSLFFTILYLYWPQPAFQHTSYGILVVASFILEMQLIKLKNCAICKKLFILSTSIYLFGFFLWNLDNIFCSSLQAVRNNLPNALNPLTQLHGWWHCLAGYGTYLQVLFTIHASYDFRYEKLKSITQLRPAHWGFSLRWSNKLAK